MSPLSEKEKKLQLDGLDCFHKAHAEETPRALERLQKVAATGGNTFDELMETVKLASLGQISDALCRIGGQYRRAM